MKSPKILSIQQQMGGGDTFKKYLEISVGRDRGLCFFIVNEIMIMIGTSLSGRLGYTFRRLGYSYLFSHCGGGVIIGCECSFRRPQHIAIDDGTVLGERVSLDVKNHGEGIFLGKNVIIGHSTVFSCPGGKIVVGEGTEIGAFCRLGSLEGLTLGKNVKIGENSYIVGAGHDYRSLDVPIIKQNVICKGANKVGDDVVIGNRVTVLDGVEIGSGAHILDDSLVNRNIPEKCTASGVPAKIHE
jgi:acetyltransferase-like isoleucine patch superfamily enzyme